MHIRRAFTVFLDLKSQASPAVVATASDWTLDWRWFCEAADAVLPSEPSLIDCSAWARSRTLSPLP